MGAALHQNLFVDYKQATVDAVIFDIDGTILDSVDLHIKAWQRAFSRFGENIPSTRIRPEIGKDGHGMLAAFFSRQRVAQFGTEIEKYHGDVFRKDYLPRVKAFPQVRQLFKRIKRDNKIIELASSSKRDDLKRYKKIAEIADLVDFEVPSDLVKRSKPFPDIFQAALKKIEHLDPKNVIVIADTAYDAQATAKANLRMIGLLCGGSNEEQLREAGCIAIYQNPADLLAHYEQSPLRHVTKDDN